MLNNFFGQEIKCKNVDESDDSMKKKGEFSEKGEILYDLIRKLFFHESLQVLHGVSGFHQWGLFRIWGLVIANGNEMTFLFPSLVKTCAKIGTQFICNRMSLNLN